VTVEPDTQGGERADETGYVADDAPHEGAESVGGTSGDDVTLKEKVPGDDAASAKDEPGDGVSSDAVGRRAPAWLAARPVLAVVVAVALAAVALVGVGVAAALSTTDDDLAYPARGFASGLDAGAQIATRTVSLESSPTTGVDLLGAPPKVLSEDPPPTTELYAFYVNWDDEPYESLAANAQHIDVLVPMWYHVDSDGRLTVDDPVEQAQVLALIKSENPDMKVMPLVNNYDKSRESWNAPAVSKLLRDPERRAEIAEEIVSTYSAAGFDGVNVDFENFTAEDKASLIAFMGELYPRAKEAGLVVSMDVIVAGSAYDHAALAKNVDFMVPMMYDEHWKTSPPGPISSQPWFEKTLQKFYAQVPPEKVVVGLGVYSYDYGRSGARASSLMWKEAVALARQQGATIEFDEQQKNSHYSYSSGGVKHQVWMLDAASAFNQMAYAADTGARGYAFWRLGAEDPALWKVIPERDGLDAAAAASLRAENRTVTFDEESGLVSKHRLQP
jgi:spore germination protein YaaH